MKMMSDEKGYVEEQSQVIKNVLAISGEKGEGKTTVATNLAIAIAKTGARVALVDTDLTGLSIPSLFAAQHQQFREIYVDGRTSLQPVMKYGIKIFSPGFASAAHVIPGTIPSLERWFQLFELTDWEETDYMIIDFPAGKGNMPRSMIRRLRLSGAIVVTTSQRTTVKNVAGIVDMFLTNPGQVPVLGIVENNCVSAAEDLPGRYQQKIEKAGGVSISEYLQIPLLGQLPYCWKIKESFVDGIPVAQIGFGLVSIEFDKIARQVIKKMPVFQDYWY